MSTKTKREKARGMLQTVIKGLFNVIFAVVSFGVVWLLTVTQDHGTRLTKVELSNCALVESVHTLTESIEKLVEQQRALVMLATFRTDPWSGTMAEHQQNELFDILQKFHPELRYSDMPDVQRIQREFAQDLIPESLLKD